MGEYAEEAIQNGLGEEFRKEEIYPRYNNDIWEDITGKHRSIRCMDSMHLCFIINYILSGYCKVKGNRVYLMSRILVNRGFTYREFKFHLENIKLGLYCMYEQENGEVERYYTNLLKKYPNYDWSPLKKYMKWN